MQYLLKVSSFVVEQCPIVTLHHDGLYHIPNLQIGFYGRIVQIRRSGVFRHDMASVWRSSTEEKGKAEGIRIAG